MRYPHLLSVREQMIVDPAGENRCFHGYGPGLRKRLHPAVQFPACCSDLACLGNLTARILDAVADRLLVNIQSDVIQMSLRSLRRWRIVDEGGGHGLLLAGILFANPRLCGVLYYLPAVVAHAS